MFKPSLLLTSAILFALVLGACGSTTTPIATPTEVPATPEAKPFRVAVLTPSAVNDLAFSQSMYDALVRIQEEMGGPEKMTFVYSQGMFVIADAAAAIRTYASQGYDLVIAHGSQYGESLKEIAPEFPKTSFAWGTTAETFDLPNVFAYEAASQEGGYVNGVLAASLTTSKMIGVIGPIEVGDAKLYVDGFKAGVTATNPDIQVDVNYIGSFSDVVLASDTAAGYITAGADILTGTAQMVVGPIGQANESNVLWFGTQSNQTSIAPRIVVANQVYHWEVVLRDIIAKIQAGTLGGESFTLNLANSGLVIEYNPDYALPANVKALGETTAQGIADGTISVDLP
jgi:basic membrane lipoprotein Med (substrate-binding protein (PBP1-ABC) superfamily)